jgi:quercetin dioxygenase-like cupin family protein
MRTHLYSVVFALGLFTITACASASLERQSTISDSNPAILLDNGEGGVIDFPLHPTTRLASANATQSGLSLFEIAIVAQAAGAPPHRHTHEDEFFYVREGRITFIADGVSKTISKGGLALLPRGGWHAMWNDGDMDAILLVGTSAGQFDDFFDAVAMQVAESGDLSPPEIGALVAQVGAERGITIDMKKIPDGVRHLYGLPPAE